MLLAGLLLGWATCLGERRPLKLFTGALYYENRGRLGRLGVTDVYQR
jgi:hypothetical protein